MNERHDSAISVEGTERLGTAVRIQNSEDRLRELETENARLKSLVGELLVTNQLLREASRKAKDRETSDVRPVFTE